MPKVQVLDAAGIKEVSNSLRVYREATYNDAIQKGINLAIDKATEEAEEHLAIARQEGAYVNRPFAMYGLYGNVNKGAYEKTGITFKYLREWRKNCPPASAAVGKISSRPVEFCQIAKPRKYGFMESPAFRIRMTDPSAMPSAEDRKMMDLWSHFILEGGFAEPPEEERIPSWEPGLAFIAQSAAMDMLDTGWGGIRFWKGKMKTGQELPVACFTSEDAASIRIAGTRGVDVRGGKLITEEYERERTNTRKPIRFVRVNDSSSQQIEEFTAENLAMMRWAPSTDRNLTGYSQGPTESALSTITDLIFAREYSSSRFRKNSIPKGIVLVKGNVSDPAMAEFRLDWELQMKGLANEWSLPLLRMNPGSTGATGQGLEFMSLDQNPRDLEYSNYLYTMIVWMCAIYGVHPEEIGFAGASPFHQPLQGGSDKDKIEQSQDDSLKHIMRPLCEMINRRILWKIDPSRRYTFEWEGMSDANPIAEENLVGMMLNNGTVTPRKIWESRDQEIPESLKDNPAWDLPTPFMAGLAYIDNLEAQQRQEEMEMEQEKEQEMQMAQQQQEQAQQAQEEAVDARQQAAGPYSDYAYEQAAQQQADQGQVPVDDEQALQ